MAKYRNKTLVQAFKFDGDLINSKGKYYVPEWAVKSFHEGKLFFNPEIMEQCIINNGGIYNVGLGDYIIRDSQGELHTCTEEVFNKTYEKISSRNGNKLIDCLNAFNSLNINFQVFFLIVIIDLFKNEIKKLGFEIKDNKTFEERAYSVLSELGINKDVAKYWNKEEKC